MGLRILIIREVFFPHFFAQNMKDITFVTTRKTFRHGILYGKIVKINKIKILGKPNLN